MLPTTRAAALWEGESDWNARHLTVRRPGLLPLTLWHCRARSWAEVPEKAGLQADVNLNELCELASVDLSAMA